MGFASRTTVLHVGSQFFEDKPTPPDTYTSKQPQPIRKLIIVFLSNCSHNLLFGKLFTKLTLEKGTTIGREKPSAPQVI